MIPRGVPIPWTLRDVGRRANNASLGWSPQPSRFSEAGHQGARLKIVHSLGTREANQGPCNSFLLLRRAVPYLGQAPPSLADSDRVRFWIRRGRVPAAAPTHPRAHHANANVTPPRLIPFPSPRPNTFRKHARPSWALGSFVTPLWLTRYTQPGLLSCTVRHRCALNSSRRK